MGKPTGFLEYERKACSRTEPLERIKNFDEFYPPLPEEERRRQGARCMNCGVPFCQSGMQLSGMFTGCPLHNLIPEWNDAVYQGNLKEAYTRLQKTSNFPEFTGRVCPALCECACTCGLNSQAVTVHDNERYIIEKAWEEGLVKPRPPRQRSGKKIAVVGSGPSGLACADSLNRRGHTVTVFERENMPGGLLMYGIPNMKLDKKVVARRVELMKEEGVEFRCGVNVGAKNESPETQGEGSVISADELLSGYDAVVICAGSKKPRDLSVPGRDANGVYFAVDFLTMATKKVTGQVKEFAVSAKGKDVVIVGGGDTGNDCVGTAIRQGCKSVTQLEMMPRPLEKRAETNPWPEWPLVLKTDYGQEEAIAKFGSDPRIYQTTVKEILKDKNGNIKELVTVKLSPEKDRKTGRTNMVPVEGSEEKMPCGLLLLAAGFIGCEEYVAEAFSLERSQRGTLMASEDDFKTERDKVFACGDARRGQSLVVWGISEGRRCAASVDEYLMGYSTME